MSKQDDYLKKYLGFDPKYLEDLDYLDENVKKIVDNNQSKDEKYKVLNAIKSERHFLEQPDTPNTVILALMNITIMIFIMFFDNMFKLKEWLGDNGQKFLIIVLGISTLAILFLLLRVVIKFPKVDKRKNEKIKALHYIELELERICNDSESNQ